MKRSTAKTGGGMRALAVLGLALGGCNGWDGIQLERTTLLSTVSVTQAGDEGRMGWYDNQPGLTPSLVTQTNMGQIFKTALTLTPGEQVLAQPLVWNGKLFVATEANNLYLLDEATGAITTSRALGAAFNAQANGLSCGDVLPTVGITGTPVIDRSTNTAYFFSKGSTGAWKLYGVNATDLTDRFAPVTIAGTAQNEPAHTFNPVFHHQRPGLLLMNGIVYGAFGAHCDQGTYRGWIIGVSTTTHAITALFSTERGTGATGSGGGIWMSGAGLASDGPGQILFSTGNGFNGNVYPNPIASNTDPGPLDEAVARVVVQGDGTLKTTDFFAPFNAGGLGDSDLGAGGVVALPSQFGTAAFPHLAVVAGKEGYLYLLNRDRLGGYRTLGAGTDDVLARVAVGNTWTRPAVWPGDGGYIYIMVNGGPGPSSIGFRLKVLKYGLDGAGKPTLAIVGQANEDFGQYSGSPIVTSNGTSSGSALVWATNLGAELRAYDAVPVNGVLNLRYANGYGSQAKFTTVGVGSGRVYVGSANGFVVGWAPAPAVVSGNPVAFGNVGVGTPVTMTATIKANQTVQINGLATSSGVFTLGTPTPNPLPQTLAANATMTVPVTFKPTVTGPVTASLNVTTQASGTISAITLTGTGTAAGPVLTVTPTPIDFRTVQTGKTGSVNLVLQNAGSQTLTFAATTNPAAPYTVTGPASGATLPSGATVTATVTFAPAAIQTYTGTVTFNSDGGNVAVPLTGKGGTAAHMVIVPDPATPIDFGTVAAGATATRSFTITNTGDVDLNIVKSKAPPLGKFMAQTTLAEPTVIVKNQVLTETVAFSSTTGGTFTDAWIITGDDTNVATNVNFTGVVSAPLSRTGWVASAAPASAGDTPAKAIDGQAGTRFSSGTSQVPGQWFQVDMGTSNTLSSLTMDSTGSNNDYAHGYQVFVSPTDGPWTGTPVATGTGTAALLTVSFPAVTGRYLRVVQTSTTAANWWSIHELNAYGTAGGGTGAGGSGGATGTAGSGGTAGAGGTAGGAPLPRAGWLASATVVGGADTPDKALDGNLGTRFSTGAPQAAGQQYQVDMLSAQTFDKLTMDSGADYARGFQVFVSNDGTNFGTAVATGAPTANPVTVTFAAQTARYVRIVQTSATATNWWSIYELNVYAAGGGAGLTALARTGWTGVGTPADVPANALDGALNTRWTSGAAQVANGSQTYTVDMQAPRTFRQVTLDANGSNDYPRGYQVFVSTDGLNFGAAIASGAPTTPLVTITFPAQTARYIKIVQTGAVAASWWSLHELNVYN